jgi:hypothetical protein
MNSTRNTKFVQTVILYRSARDVHWQQRLAQSTDDDELEHSDGADRLRRTGARRRRRAAAPPPPPPAVEPPSGLRLLPAVSAGPCADATSDAIDVDGSIVDHAPQYSAPDAVTNSNRCASSDATQRTVSSREVGAVDYLLYLILFIITVNTFLIIFDYYYAMNVASVQRATHCSQ